MTVKNACLHTKNIFLNLNVPEVSRFYGIIIRMFFNDHAPPHFHAVYGNYSAQINISTGQIMNGELPSRAMKLVEDWTELHRNELLENYRESQKQGGVIKKIEPLI
jgi:Domain of unknown function (DUF4160)